MDGQTQATDFKQLGTSRQSMSPLTTDWSLHFCQEIRTDPLQCLAGTKRTDCGAGYKTSADNLIKLLSTW